MKIYHIFIFFFIILGISHAQLSLIQGEDVTENTVVLEKNRIINCIDTESALVLGTPLLTSDRYSVVTLDETWDTTACYYILYNRSRITYNSALEYYGTILFVSSKYYIFKTRYEDLTQFSDFHPYELELISNTQIFKTLEKKINVNFYSKEYQEPIQNIVNSISIDTIWKQIGALQKMERGTNSSGSQKAADYLKTYLEQFNYKVSFHSWYRKLPNIVAEKKGTSNSDSIILVGGHYDAVAGMPGADDNGSGTAACMEMARVLSDHTFKYTIRIVLFSGEEIGLLGSKAYVNDFGSDNIVAMLNLDMIAYNDKGSVELDVSWGKYDNLFTVYKDMNTKYVKATLYEAKNVSWSSDHKSFWAKGIPALYFGDDFDPKEPHPHYHKATDVIGKGANSKENAELMTKSVVACFAAIAVPDEVTQNGMHANAPFTNKYHDISIKTFNNGIKVINKTDKPFHVTVRGLNGRYYLSKYSLNDTYIPLENYTNGIYVFTITSAKGHHIRKVVLTR